MIKVVRDPKENPIKIACKSVLVSRSSSKDIPEGDEYRTLIIKLFTINNPHKTQEFPIKTYEFTNTEKIRLQKLNISYYLEGNDIVVNDLEEAYITKENNKLVLKGYQLEVEKR